MREPAELIEDLERHPKLPPGSEERFFGYGVMGLPFRWWTFYQDQPPELACTRYFGAEVDEVRQRPSGCRSRVDPRDPLSDAAT
jgi:hypothetical protein